MKKIFRNLADAFRKRPLLFISCIISNIAIFPVVIAIFNFLVAVTPEEAKMKSNILMPSTWEAGVMNHGKYSEWYTISNHPILFSLCVLAFLGLIMFQRICFNIFKEQ